MCHHVLVAEQRGLVPSGELQVSREAAGQNLKQFVTKVVPLGTALTRVLICKGGESVSQDRVGAGHSGWRPTARSSCTQMVGMVGWLVWLLC